MAASAGSKRWLMWSTEGFAPKGGGGGQDKDEKDEDEDEVKVEDKVAKVCRERMVRRRRKGEES